MAVSTLEFLERLAASGVLADAEVDAIRAENTSVDPQSDAEPLIRQLHRQWRLALVSEPAWGTDF